MFLVQHFGLLPKHQIAPDPCLLILLIPGAHVDMKLMQCFADHPLGELPPVVDRSAGTIPTALGSGAGLPATGSSLGTRGCTNGYWHACYSHSGRIPLVEDDADHLYLKGCSGLKGNFHTKGADKGTGKGKGTDSGKGISA